MHAHVVTDEQEIPRARATADVLDSHEHEHRDLKRRCIDVRRDDERALQPRVEPAVGKGKDEMRQHGGSEGAQGETDGERHGAVRVDERAGEQRESRSDHERTGEPFGAAAPGGEACAHERETGQDGERPRPPWCCRESRLYGSQ